MIHLNLIRNILIVLISVSFFSCDHEELTDLQDNSMDFQSEVINDRESEIREVILLIEWNESVDRERKETVRNHYKNEGILFGYYICEDEKFETWTIGCPDGYCSKESDTPVDTDDEVKRLYLHITCETKK